MEKTVKQLHYELLGNTMITALEKRRMEAYYCPTAKDALKKALELIPEGSSVSWGGSVTITDIGLKDEIRKGNYVAIDREVAKDPQEAYEIQRQGLLSDFFLTSTNAITEDGILVNIDGMANRVASIAFGPKNVIIICGMNKVTSTLESAIARARSQAAPINAMRFDINTPCHSTGTCHNCKSDDCICTQFLITRMSKVKNRIKVILVGEEIGF